MCSVTEDDCEGTNHHSAFTSDCGLSRPRRWTLMPRWQLFRLSCPRVAFLIQCGRLSISTIDSRCVPFRSIADKTPKEWFGFWMR